MDEIEHLHSAAEQEARFGELNDAEQREVKSMLPAEMLRGIENAKEQKKISLRDVLAGNRRID